MRFWNDKLDTLVNNRRKSHEYEQAEHYTQHHLRFLAPMAQGQPNETRRILEGENRGHEKGDSV